MEKVLAKKARRAGIGRLVFIPLSCCIRFCVVCDPGCRLFRRVEAPRGNPISKRKHSNRP
jgi:hypothetical protein